MKYHMQQPDHQVARDVELPTHAEFAENQNGIFRVSFPPEKFSEIRLVAVSEHVIRGPQEQFSLTFRGSPEVFMPQGTYELFNDKLGSFDLFLVPIGRDADGFSYEAVFNNLRESG